MLVRCGKTVCANDRFKGFYSDILYQYLLNLDIVNDSEVLSSKTTATVEINKIRLLFTYIFVLEDKLELLHSLMACYSKMSTLDIGKITMHDGLLFLYQNFNIFISLLGQAPQGNQFNGTTPP